MAMRVPLRWIALLYGKVRPSLAATSGIHRATDAIKMLMAKSLLASRPKVGSWVEPRERWNLLDRDVLAWYSASPDRGAFLKTVQEFRHIIEPEATALAAERRTDEQMAEISQACREMGTAESVPERTAADSWPSRPAWMSRSRCA